MTFFKKSIIHQKAVDKSLRNQAMKIGIKSISVEIGNPQIFQKRFINQLDLFLFSN